MSRILKTGSNQITNPYSGHTGWSKGVDVVKYKGQIDDIIAHTDGTIIKVVNYMTGTNKQNDKEGMGYGNYVMILHPDTYNNKYVVTVYGHLDNVATNIKEGSQVTKGQVLGKMGNTGNSYGAHLHFEIRLYDDAPQGYLHDVNKFKWIDSTSYIDTNLPCDVKIVGFLDHADYNKGYIYANGWGYQGNNNYPVEVRMYKNNKVQAVIETYADKSRPDVVKVMGYSSDKVGYTVNQYFILPDGQYEVKAFLNDVQLNNTKTIIVKNELTAKSYNDYPANSGQYYRIRKSFKDSKSSLGSYEKWGNVFNRWKISEKQGYHIYDNNGKQLD